jgi:hypothetical protein
VTCGDGGTVEGGTMTGTGTVRYTYRAAGDYNLSAHLTSADGSTVRETIRVTVRQPQQAVLLVSIAPAIPVAGEAATVTVQATTGGQPTTGSLRVTFGDGGSADGGNIRGTGTVRYTYAAAGDYNLSAHVTLADGSTIRETIRVSVVRGTSPPPSPPPPSSGGDAIDPREVTWLHADVSRWTVTSKITDVSIGDPPLCIEHTKSGRWPVVDGTEGNPWVFAQINGRWYAGTYEWLRPGQTCKQIDAGNIGPHVKRSPLETWRPKSGELVGFMVSTLARDSKRSVDERTNIVLVRWP